jgi:hypothetical protein
VSVPDPYNLVGAVVDGRYRVEAVAGQGGHAVVYRALHLSFESRIALKVLKLPADLAPHEVRAKVAGDEPAQCVAACLDPAVRPSPRNRGVAVDDEVEAVFNRALAIEPRQRIRDVAAFWTSLCRAVHASDAPGSAALVLGTLQARSRRSDDQSAANEHGCAPSSAASSRDDDASEVDCVRADGPRSRTTVPPSERHSIGVLSTEPAMASTAREPRIKGVAFRTLDLCFERLRGETARTGARGLMPHELAEAFRYRTLLAANWYPVSWYRETFRAFRAMTREGPELARELGRLTARHDMSSVYKQITARLISPQALLALSQRLFHTYYDTGECDVVESRPGYAHVRCANCVGWDHNVWMEFAGSCESLVDIAGGNNPRLRVMSGGRDSDSHIEFQVHWSQ